MAEKLNRYFVSKNLDDIIKYIRPDYQRSSQSLKDHVTDDGSIAYESIRKDLFPLTTAAAADRGIDLLVSEINRVARENGIAIQFQIDPKKKKGTGDRLIWCESVDATPALPYLSELKAIPEGTLSTGQRALELGGPIILMTFNEHETVAVREVFADIGEVSPPDTSGKFPITTLGIIGGRLILHLVSQQGRLQALDAAKTVVNSHEPHAIIALGIAFGMTPGKQHIGDVLVASHIRDYELTKVNSDGSQTPRGSKVPMTGWIHNQLRHLQQTRGDQPQWPRLEFGTVMSGDKLLDHRPSRDELKKFEPEAIGGEMEGAGVELAVRDLQIGWAVIKAICDWADGNKGVRTKDADQRLAARNAAMVVKALLELGAPPGSGRARPDNPAPYQPPSMSPPTPSPILTDRQKIPDGHFRNDALGRPITFRKDDLLAASREVSDSDQAGEEVLPSLHRWIEDSEAPPLLALLGEYGMGKTITCQQLVRDLDAARQKDPQQRIALYFDLRHVTLPPGRVPTLSDALEECMSRGWHSRAPGFAMENIHEWIAQGAVVIFDGLDEVLVKLDTGTGQIFTNNLLKIIADSDARKVTRRPKVLITCRTNYFPSLRAQQTHFTSQERGEVTADRYKTLLLLPWTEDQIQGYLKAALPELNIDAVREMIAAVHDLGDVVQRPFTLKLIAEYIPDLERQRVAGRPVSGVTLYRQVAQRWLDRDDGKHHIQAEHKLRLVAHLSAFLWGSGQSVLTADKLQEWFHQWRTSQPNFLRYAHVMPDQLEEDLRTATFLVRQDDEAGSAFRFAHTSLSEFFLADYLFQAVREGKPERWSLPVPSAETLDFLGQMIKEADAADIMRTLHGWRKSKAPQVTTLLLAYGMRASSAGWPVPNLNGIVLEQASLGRWDITGQTATPIDIRGAIFRDCDLNDAKFTGLDLEDVSFQGSRLHRVVFTTCELRRVAFAGVGLSGAVFNNCEVEECSWGRVDSYRTQFIDCNLVAIDEIIECKELIIVGNNKGGTDYSSLSIEWLTGHKYWVNNLAWSKDGRLMSAGDGGTIKIWDGKTGEVLRSIVGSGEWINDCAWSEDGRIAAVFGKDGLRIWEGRRYEPLPIPQGDFGHLSTCAWSLDGRLAFAGASGLIYILDAGEKTPRILKGHRGSIETCAWSSDGRLASAGDDGVIRIWDTVANHLLAELQDHNGTVLSCAWSPDGRLVSGGSDGIVRVWDVDRLKLKFHRPGYDHGIFACQWGGDDSVIISSMFMIQMFSSESGEITFESKTYSNAFSRSDDGDFACITDGANISILVLEKDHGPLIMDNAGGWIGDVQWFDDKNLLICSSNEFVDIFNVEINEIPRRNEFSFRHYGLLSLSYFGDYLSVPVDNSVHIYDMACGLLVSELKGHMDKIIASVWSKSGQLATISYDGDVCVWDPIAGKRLATFEQREVPLECRWSDDGRLAVVCGDGEVKVWYPHSGKLLTCFREEGIQLYSCSWSGEGLLALGGQYGFLKIWNPETGRISKPLTGHSGPVRHCSWHTDGRLATVESNGQVNIWHGRKKKLISTLPGKGSVSSCSWSPSGRLAVGRRHGVVEIWDVEAARIIVCYGLGEHSSDNHAHAAVWSPDDGKVLAATDRAWRSLSFQCLDEQGKLFRRPFGKADMI